MAKERIMRNISSPGSTTGVLDLWNDWG